MRLYQQDVERWVSPTSFLTFDAELFGDAYDVTKEADHIGGLVFDFSLRLGRGDLARHILYGEGKYRELEPTGNVNADFKDFLKRVYKALSAGEVDEVDSAIFVFFSNLPPDDWRKFLKNKQRYCKTDLDSWEPNESPDEELLTKLTGGPVHVLVLSAQVVSR